MELISTTEDEDLDHGVMEKVSRMAMVPGDFGWSDLGSWLAASEIGRASCRERVCYVV